MPRLPLLATFVRLRSRNALSGLTRPERAFAFLDAASLSFDVLYRKLSLNSPSP